jgi:hypothetical protein
MDRRQVKMQNIWDLKPGDKFRLIESGLPCVVVTTTQNGKGLTVRYLEGELKDHEDFIFEREIDFSSRTGAE